MFFNSVSKETAMVKLSKWVINFGKKLSPLDTSKLSNKEDWEECSPKFIKDALKQALTRPNGGWYVVDSHRSIGKQPKYYKIKDKELVAYRKKGEVVIGSNYCPHMAGPLAGGHMKGDELVCPWHGLRLPSEKHPHWKTHKTYDDGVLIWVQMEEEDNLTDKPIIPQRPDTFVDAVIRKEADCEPFDIVANRLDPWHGAHYHPHTFARLKVFDYNLDQLSLRVAYRVMGPLCVEVDAMFFSPEPNSIVMRIIDGDGKGSLVETHATPISKGKTAVVEATIASSDRLGFKILKLFPPFLRPFMEQNAARLWIEDIAYAERIHHLRGIKK